MVVAAIGTIFAASWLLSVAQNRRRRARVIVRGLCELPSVAAEFRSLFEEGRERGAQVAVMVDGRVVVDLVGGRDEACVLSEDQVAVVHSTSKVIESLVMATLVDRGLVRYEDKLSLYVPGFYSDAVTVADLMKHRAGAARFLRSLTLNQAAQVLEDPDKLRAYVTTSLSRDYDASRPHRQMYHALSRGMLTALVLCQVTGQTPDEFVQRSLVQPVRTALTESSPKVVATRVVCHIGAPPELQSKFTQHERQRSDAALLGELMLHRSGVVAALRPRDTMKQEVFDRDWITPDELEFFQSVVNPASPAVQTMAFLTGVDPHAHATANNLAYRALPMLSGTACTNALGLAAMLGEVCRDGGVLLSPSGLAKALETDGPELEEVMGINVAFCNAGWGLDLASVMCGGDASLRGWIGWAGTGGSMAVFHVERHTAFAFVPSTMIMRMRFSEAGHLLRAVVKDLHAMGREGLASKGC